MAVRRVASRWWWVLLLPLAAGAAWYASRDRVGESPEPHPSRVRSLPPPAPSPYLNTTDPADYVGSRRCAECHSEQHASYLQTAHSLALSEVDPDREPPDADFLHRLSGRHYRVYREDGRLRHRESLPLPPAAVREHGEEIVLNDYPLKYLVGSGRHSRTYLVEIDGFLVESPVTWYASTQSWAMSPGYDQPAHGSFQRTAEVGCLICHAGHVEPLPESVHKVRLHELAIGCESCHGPGSLHVERHTAGDSAANGREDLTIVHPGRLSRERQEDICAVCHLRGDATVFIRGRGLTDFRPGLRLSDFRIDYALAFDDREMKVVGHMEQMRLSRCYTESETLTCTTCHEPHAPPAAETRLEHYRGTCLSCHEPASCGVPIETRRERQPDDNCITCHMPQVPTDIPHIAFTHHRIGRHSPGGPERDAPDRVGRLVPLVDTAHVPEMERERLLGLAYLEVSDKSPGDRPFLAYRNRAQHLLERVRAEQMRDGDAEAALARLLWETDRLQQAQEAARAALELPTLSGAGRINALFVLGDASVRRRKLHRSVVVFEQLVEHRRHPEDWWLLGVARQLQGTPATAIEALEQALAIDPARIDVREALADLYHRAGQNEQAAVHRRFAQALNAGHSPGR